MPLKWFKWRLKSGSCEAWTGTRRNPDAKGGFTLTAPRAAAAMAATRPQSASVDPRLTTAAITMQKIARRFLVRCRNFRIAADFVRYKVREAKEDMRETASSIDPTILQQQAQVAWGWDHDKVQVASIPRHSPFDPLGCEVVLPKQIDLVYHELELRVSEAFVLVDTLSEHSSLCGDAGLQVGDALLSVNGERFDTVLQFATLCRSNRDLEIEYLRLSEIPVVPEYVAGIKRAIVKRIARATKDEAMSIAALGSGASLRSGASASKAKQQPNFQRRKYGVYTSDSEIDTFPDGSPRVADRPPDVGSLREFFHVAYADSGSRSQQYGRKNPGGVSVSSVSLGTVGDGGVGTSSGNDAANRDAEESGIVGGEYRGFVSGSMPLPGFAVWNIAFDVRRADLHDPAAGNPNDYVSVRFGSSLETLSLAGVYHNVPPAGGGKIVCHHIELQHVGRRLAFKIQLHRNVASALADASAGRDGRLVVSDATVQMHVPDPLFEYVVTSGKHKGEKRCVSAYVQRLRLQSQQKGQRAIELFMEQERVKEMLRDHPDTREIDSRVIHGTFQRFPRDVFLRALQDEMDKEQARARAQVAELQAMREKLATTKAENLSREDRLEQKLIKSKQAYIRRRRQQRPVIDEEAAHAMVGKTCEFFHPATERWQFGVIRAVKKVWFDMGTQMQLVHKVEFLKGFDPQNDEGSKNGDASDVVDVMRIEDEERQARRRRKSLARPGTGETNAKQHRKNKRGEANSDAKAPGDGTSLAGEPSRPRRESESTNAQVSNAAKSSKSKGRQSLLTDVSVTQKEDVLSPKDTRADNHNLTSSAPIGQGDDSENGIGPAASSTANGDSGKAADSPTGPDAPTSAEATEVEADNVEWFDMNEQIYTILSSGFSSIFAARAERDRLYHNRKVNVARRAKAFQVREAARHQAGVEELEEEEQAMENTIRIELSKAEELGREEARQRVEELDEVKAQLVQVKLKLQLDEKMGVNEDRVQRMLPEDEAYARAEALYIRKFIDYKLLKCRQQCRLRRKAFKQHRQRQLAQWARDAEQRAKLFEIAQRYVTNLESNDATFLFEPLDPIPSLEAHLAKVAAQSGDQASSLSGPLGFSSAASKATQVKLRPLDVETRAALKIPDFERAAFPKRGCEHPRLKFWKTKYTNGYRCRDCGKELSHSHDDPDQISGQGIVPDDPPNPFEEFRMLRKEDGAIQLLESTFYDYDISRDMYKLNFLHELNGQTKTAGNADAVAAEEAKYAANREKALAELRAHDRSRLVLAIPEREMVDERNRRDREKPYDLRLRHARNQHIMRNKDMLTMFFRVGKYQEAIESMRRAQVAARLQQKKLSNQAGVLHREMVLGEKLSKLVGADHARADALLARRKFAQDQVSECKAVLAKLHQKRQRLQDVWDARDHAVSNAKKNYGNLLEQVEALLVLLRQSKHACTASRAKIDMLKGRMHLTMQQLVKFDEVLLKQYYTQQGRRVLTPYGPASIISHDVDTDRLKLRLLWNTSWSSKFTSNETARSDMSGKTNPVGGPKTKTAMIATVSMPAELVMRRERSRQTEELRLMAQEEMRCRTVREFERKRERLEAREMNACEHYDLRLRDVELLNEKEEEHVGKALKIIADDCRFLFDHKEDDEDMVTAYKPISDEIQRRVAEQVLKAKDALLEYQRNGGPKKPPQVTARQVKELRAKFRAQVEAQYIEGRSVTAERDIRLAYARTREADCEQRALDSIFVELLQDVMHKNLAGILNESAQARTRAEDASGLVFTVAGVGHVGLPYNKWRDLSMQWNAHKWFREALLAALGAENVVEMQARQAKEQEAMLKRMRFEWLETRGLPEAEFSVAALQAIWAREEEEAEQRAINEDRERKAMEAAERDTREFNAWELKVRLDTRRAMAKEEAYMRKLMAQERVLRGDDDDDDGPKRRGKNSKKRPTKAKRRWNKVDTMIAAATMTSSKLARRAFLKERHVERMRQKREWPLMEAEDEFGFHLRSDTLRMEAERKAKIAASLAANMGDAGGAEFVDGQGDLASMLAAMSAGHLKIDFSNPAFLQHLRNIAAAEWSESSDEEWLSGSDYEWETDDEAQHEKEQEMVRAGRRVRRRRRNQRRRNRRASEATTPKTLAFTTSSGHVKGNNNQLQVEVVPKASHVRTANSEPHAVTSPVPAGATGISKAEKRRLHEEKRKRKQLAKRKRVWRKKRQLPGTISQRFLTALASAEESQESLQLGVPSASADSSELLPPAPVAAKPIDPKLLFVFWFRDLYPALLAAPSKRRALLRQMDRLKLPAKKKAGHLRKLDAQSEAMRLAVCNVIATQLELARMREDLTAEVARYEVLKHNKAKVGIKSRAKGYRELTLRRALERERAALEVADADLEACREEILDAEEDLEDADQELEVATQDTVYFDTSFIHGTMQRYRLDDIYPQLHKLSFQKIVEIIVTRAEVCATERQLRDVAEFIQENGRKIRRKEHDLRQLKRNTLRRERMCTKRSFLAQRGFFPKSRRIALATAFGGWVSLMSFRGNIHKAFDLRFALLKQEQEIKLFKEETGLADKKRQASSARGNALGRREDVLVEEHQDPFNAKQHPKFIRSHMHGHVSHRIRCKFCNKWFMEAQNHAEACTYHPGKYVMSCPDTCPYYKGKKPAYSCRAHYRWRWSCCGVAKDEPFMANGCQHRFHVAGKDALYEHIVEEAEELQKRKHAEDDEREKALKTALTAVHAHSGKVLRKAENSAQNMRSHLSIYRSSQNRGAVEGGGMYAAQQEMSAQNAEQLKRFFGPPPTMQFTAQRAEEIRGIQKEIDAGRIETEFTMARRKKLVHPDSDDDLGE
eukprot:INCI6214.3.p1 GENE.INCI6214.3~~INCI6214.3.p1  ORF type:complete len:2817 (-),score=567.99 INCI6214.3:465-8915(-)